jgi:Flp pilus assembly pilin Flp
MTERILAVIRAVVTDTGAAGLTDYAVLAGLIAVVVITGLVTIGGSLAGYINAVAIALGGGS